MIKDKEKRLANLLVDAASQVERLRQDNQVMGEKLELVEGLLSLTKLRGPVIGMSPNIAWGLREAARELLGDTTGQPMAMAETGPVAS